MTRREHLGPAVASLAIVLILPFSWILAKNVSGFSSPTFATTTRTLFASLSFLAIGALQGRGTRLQWPRPRDMAWICMLALTGFVGYFYLMFYSLAHLSPSQVGVYTALMPGITYGIGLSMRSEQATWRKTIGLIIASAAAVAFSLWGAGPLGGRGWPMLAALGAALSYAFFGVLYKKHLSHIPLPRLLPLITGISACVLVALSPTEWFEFSKALPWQSLGWTVLLGTVFTAPVYYLYFYLIRSKGAVYTNTLGLTTPFLILMVERLYGYRASVSPVQLALLAACAAGLFLVISVKK